MSSNVLGTADAAQPPRSTARDPEAAGVRSVDPVPVPDRAVSPSAQAHDPVAFEQAVSPYYDALVRRLVAVLRDRQAAEDIAQETYLRAFRSWDRFDGADTRGWLFTIALRLAFNERRRIGRLLAALRRVEPTRVAGPASPDLWEALGRLDVRTRSVLLLSAVDGYTQREIAAMVGVPEGTVSSWLSRGRATLRAELADRPVESSRSTN